MTEHTDSTDDDTQETDVPEEVAPEPEPECHCECTCIHDTYLE